jgi:hypothetical protein
VLRAALPPGTRRRRTGRASRCYDLCIATGRRELIIDGGLALMSPSDRALQDLLEGDIALHVAASAPRHVFIHAGVVGWRGKALLLPGRTMSGKSTLVDSLVRRGATYHSDEYAVVDERGRIHPYPRRMSLRRRAGLPRRVLPDRVGTRGLTPGWVLGSRYEAGRAGLQVEPLSAGRTALLLLDNAVAAQLFPARVLEAVRLVSQVAKGSMLLRGEARAAAKDLLLLLSTQGNLNGI